LHKKARILALLNQYILKKKLSDLVDITVNNNLSKWFVRENLLDYDITNIKYFSKKI
jgi:hypothetical protein